MKKTIFIISFLLPVILFGQEIVVKKAISDSRHPQITWWTSGTIDTLDFQAYRASVKDNKYEEIRTLHYVKPSQNSDSLEFVLIDTTLTKKGLYLYYIQVRRNGKKVTSEVAYGHNFGLLPEPRFKTFRAIPLKDRKAVRLEWELDFPQTVSSLTLYRSRFYEKGYVKVSELPADTNSFTDVVTVSNEPWFYFMVINDYFGNRTPGVRIPAFAVFAEKPVRPQNIHGRFNDDTLVITWKNAGNNIIGYRVYRSLDNNNFRLLNTMNGVTGTKSVFKDYSPELKKSIKAKYYVRTVSDGFVESNSSDTLEFYFAEHEPVLPPTVADKIIDNNGNVKLLWMPPSEGLTLAYNVYLTDGKGHEQLLTKTPVHTNSFTDTVYRSEGKYTYAVEGVGINNRTSANKTPVTVFRYRPAIHVILNLTRLKEGIGISWKRPLNSHITSLTLYKQAGDNKAVALKTFPNDNDYTVTDKDVSHGTVYLYKLSATMENGDEITVNEGVEIRW